MARTAAIFLIAVHLMSIIGCYGILALEASHQDRISSELNEDEYAGANTITLRIPFSLPYSTLSPNYERVQGKIEYENQVYHLVKQKFHNDTLLIVCVKDSKLTKIKDVFEDLSASMGDHEPEGKPSGKVASSLVIDFEPCTIVQFDSPFLFLDLGLPHYTFSSKVNSEFPVDQPPKG
jgi:hypothetical protein